MLELAVVKKTRKLRPYFQGHQIMLKINNLACQALKKLKLTGKMIDLYVKISEYDIH